METKTQGDSFAGSNFEPGPVTPAEIVPDHEVRWGVRWPSLHPAPEGHTDRWYDSEDEAWAVRNTTRGDAHVIRQTVTLGPVEVIDPGTGV